MGNTENNDTGTQCDDDEQDKSTQTASDSMINYELEMQLGILANRLLHGSYWFLILEIIFTSKDLRGLAGCAKQRENVCRESASSIMSWLMENMGTVRMADIAKPDYYVGKEEITAEYAVWTMAALDTWLEQGLRVVVEIVTEQDREAVLVELLRKILEEYDDLQLETQAMKDRIFL